MEPTNDRDCSGEPGRRRPVPTDLLTQPWLELPTSSGLCWTCDLCNDDDPWAESVPGSPSITSAATFCRFQSYTCNLATCAPTEDDSDQIELEPEEITRIWNTGSGGSARAIESLLAEFPHNVWLNHERGALQFTTACVDFPIGSIPLSASQIEDLDS